MSGPIPNISGVSHNYELFEFAKILCMNVIEYDTIPPRPQKPKPAVLPHGNPHIMIVKAAGYVGHAFIAIATENSMNSIFFLFYNWVFSKIRKSNNFYRVLILIFIVF